MLAREILEQIQRDVTSFADPGTDVRISGNMLTWSRGRHPYQAQLVRKPSGFPDVSVAGRQLSYQGFLASDSLADLRDLAQSIATQIPFPKQFIDGPARVQSSFGGPSGKTPDVVFAAIQPDSLPLASTRVVFIHGNAGTGKTSALTYVTRKQADRYLRGETSTLFLYLDAQGKGLVQLEDVMARALQDLRARFTYHSVAALTRHQCLIPVVDGFDELIGPSSAREAFANLAQFLSQLDCGGVLVASSRSAFIDYKTLHERAAEIAEAQQLSYEIYPIEVVAWPSTSVMAYCDARHVSESVKDQVKVLMGSDAGGLITKPFYLSRICDLLEEGVEIDGDKDITRQVIEATLQREAGKLSDQRGKELLSAEQHRAFCEELADEMWAQGTPELDCETIRLLAEIFADQIRLTGKDRKTLIDRSIAHGLLTSVPGVRPEKRSFEHELLRFEFQAGRLANYLKNEPEACEDYICRGEIPLEVVSRVPTYQPWTGDKVATTVTRLGQMAVSSSQYAAPNAGALAAALVCDREDLPANVRFTSLYFRACDFGRCTLTRATFHKCVLERIQLTKTTLCECVISQTQLISCVVGPATRWDGTHLRPSELSGIVWRANGSEEEIYDWARIEELLQKGGGEIEGAAVLRTTETQKSRVALVEKLLQHARTHYYLAQDDPWVRTNLDSNKDWESVKKALERHKLIEEVRLSKSGRPEKFLRLTAPPDVVLRARVSGAPAAAEKFWKEMLE